LEQFQETCNILPKKGSGRPAVNADTVEMGGFLASCENARTISAIDWVPDRHRLVTMKAEYGIVGIPYQTTGEVTGDRKLSV
jgi:hypothetical protein